MALGGGEWRRGGGPGLEVQRSCQAARPGTNREAAAVGRECALRGRDANIEDR